MQCIFTNNVIFQVHRSSVVVHLVRELVQYCLLVYPVLVQSTHQQTVPNPLVLTITLMVVMLEYDVYKKVPACIDDKLFETFL